MSIRQKFGFCSILQAIICLRAPRSVFPERKAIDLYALGMSARVPANEATEKSPAMTVPLLDLRMQYRSIRNACREAIDEVLDEQALILGRHVEDFEKRLAAYCGTKHAIGVSSGTDALLAALMALDLQAGDEVICPSFTFFATAGCVHRVGARPIFVDIDPKTFNLNADQVAEAVTPRTRAIIPVHLFGQCADMEEINRIACHQKRDGPIAVLEDAAQAIGATRNAKRAGSMGYCGALSFYPTKNLGAFGDAGAVCCDDDDLYEKLRLLRVHGSAHTYYHELVGGNFRMAAIQAVGLSIKLDHLEDWHAARRRNAAIYDEILSDSPVTTPFIEPSNTSIYNQYVVRIPPTARSRDEVKQRLAGAGVGSAIYYPMGLHEQKCFAYLGYRQGDLPETEAACREVLALPIFPELEEAQVRYAAETLRRLVGEGDR